jgi:16S rRNA (cytosine1402-N4)-methyltransferase
MTIKPKPARFGRWTMCSSSTGVVEDHSTLFHKGRMGSPRSILQPVGELQMVHSFAHIPVLRDEVVSSFATVPAGPVVDATVGGGGHSAALLSAYPGLQIIGLDRDPVALEAAAARLAPFGERVTLVHAPFSALGEVTAGPLSGVLFDLGMSSPQLDQAERGFSFRSDAAIDMRMDQTTGRTAAQLVNELPEAALAALFRENGEGRLSGRIARAVVNARPLTSTVQLAEVVSAAVPAAVRRKGHPAKRVFQALRIAVNDELGQLEHALPVALDRLAVGGRCAVISYHSGEDRLTKRIFTEASTGGCTCPPDLPCVCGAVVRHRLVFRGARRPAPRRLPATVAPGAPGCASSNGSKGKGTDGTVHDRRGTAGRLFPGRRRPGPSSVPPPAPQGRTVSASRRRPQPHRQVSPRHHGGARTARGRGRTGHIGRRPSAHGRPRPAAAGCASETQRARGEGVEPRDTVAHCP